MKKETKQKYVYCVFIFFVILPVLFLGGCFERSLTLQVRFENLSGLKRGDGVYFERNDIGRVDNITYTTQGDYLVKIEIVPEFKNAATEDSRFYIGNDPLKPPNKAVIVEQEQPGGTLLQNRSTVQGSEKKGYLDEIFRDLKDKAGMAEGELRQALEELKKSLNAKTRKLDKELEATLDDLSRQFEKFKSEISKIPDSQEIRQLEESFKRFAEEFGRVEENVRDYLRNNVIPQFRQELDRLRDQLKKEGREQELKKIDEQMNEMITV